MKIEFRAAANGRPKLFLYLFAAYACENYGNRVHRAVVCCRGIKLLLIRRSRIAFFARLRRFCVCPVSTGSPAKLGCLLYSFRWPVSLSLFNPNSYTFFHRVKEPKRPARAKISHNSLLLTRRKRHPSFACCLTQTAFRSTIGDKRTRFPRNNSNRMNTAQTAFVLFRCLNGCLL